MTDEIIGAARLLLEKDGPGAVSVRGYRTSDSGDDQERRVSLPQEMLGERVADGAAMREWRALPTGTSGPRGQHGASAGACPEGNAPARGSRQRQLPARSETG